jgi:hypothetical protein
MVQSLFRFPLARSTEHNLAVQNCPVDSVVGNGRVGANDRVSASDGVRANEMVGVNDSMQANNRGNRGLR